MIEEFELTDAVVRRKYEKLGCIASLMAHHKCYSAQRGDYLKSWIEPAIEIGQIKVIFNAMRKPVGFITWAFLAEDTVRLFLAGKTISHLSEWNEGRQLWIIDACVPNGYVNWLYTFFQSAEFADHDTIFWSRRNRSAKPRVYPKRLGRGTQTAKRRGLAVVETSYPLA
jgi:cytolysin-activating lysine-acyltransferase